MKNVDFALPTVVHFGKNAADKLPAAVQTAAGTKKVLLVYGGGSIKDNGVYDAITHRLREAGIEYAELPGIMPNPRIDSVRKGVSLCREHEPGLVLGVGGGSVIDAAKAIAAGACYSGDPWDFFIKRATVDAALPVGAVLTLAATGSEMNGGCVISNPDTLQKLPAGSFLLRPRFAILDPQYTFSVSRRQTAAGVADIFSHVLEQFFSPDTGVFLQERLGEAIFKTCIHFGPIALADPGHYEARANLMWASSLALNGLLAFGKEYSGDWAVHAIEHEISARFDVPHGVGLAILWPHWMEYVLDKHTAPKFAEYTRNTWNLSDPDDFRTARRGIAETRRFFFHTLGLPDTLQMAGVRRESLQDMAIALSGPVKTGRFKPLSQEAISTILHNAFA